MNKISDTLNGVNDFISGFRPGNDEKCWQLLSSVATNLAGSYASKMFGS